MEYTPQNIYSSDNNRSYGQTPKGVDYLLNCVKTGWANHPEYAAMGEKNVYAGLSNLFYGPSTINQYTFYTFPDSDLSVLNGDNVYVKGLNATWTSNMLPNNIASSTLGIDDAKAYKDFACYINPDNITKMGDLKSSYYIRDDLIYISQFSEIDVDKKVTLGTAKTSITSQSTALCCPSTFNGADKFTDKNTNLTVSNIYDDWIVVTDAELYARKTVDSGSRVRVDRTPFVDARLNGLNCLAFEKQKNKSNEYYKTSGVIRAQGKVLQRFTMPNFILNKNSFCYNPRGYNSGGLLFREQTSLSSTRVFYSDYQWGRFNVCTKMSKIGGFKNYPVVEILGSSTVDADREQSLIVTVNINGTSPDPAEYYGGKTFWLVKKSNYSRSGTYYDPNIDAEYRTISSYPAFSVDGGTTNFYSDVAKMHNPNDDFFIPVVAFPNETKLKDFLADWGILYCTNLDSAKNDPNTVVQNPDYPTDDPWGDTPSDPDAQPTDPWENPTTPTDPVNPDPDTPGDDPAPDAEDIPDINLTGNCYLLSRLTMNEVEQWILGADFLKDSSNVFTDKLSAINAATVFPFDLSTHDPAHTATVSAINIAGATKTLNGVKSISAAYNNCIDGGTLTYVDDWTAATPAYNAFLNANYTVNIPCLGAVQVPPSAVIGRKLVLKYYIDIISGAATAVLYSYPTDSFTTGFADNGFIVFSGGCQLGQPVPIYSSNYTQRQLAIASSTISALFAPITGGNLPQNVSKMTQNKTTIPTSAAGGAASSAALSAAGGVGIAVSALNYIGNVATAGFNAAVQNPLEFSIKGSYGAGNAWSMGLRASLTVTYQIPAKPNNYNYVMGQASSYRGTLKKFSGGNINPTKGGLNYVECAATILNVNGATETELEMIQNALSSGIFV